MKIFISLFVAVAFAASASGTAVAAPRAGTNDAMARTITVTGMGDIKAAPDQAHLSAGVVTNGRTAAEALAVNSRAMNRVFATLRRLNIADRNIQTSGFTIQPLYDPNDSRPPRKIVGYEVTNTVTVTVRGVANTGPVIDALVGAGSNRAAGVHFTIADPKPLERMARRKAVAEAVAKARTLAEASGVRLGRIVAITESGGYPPPRPYLMHRTAAATPVAAGEATVQVNVSIVYEIR
jgi:uncharacterized protein YggE